jgi:hypothetical protein
MKMTLPVPCVCSLPRLVHIVRDVPGQARVVRVAAYGPRLPRRRPRRGPQDQQGGACFCFGARSFNLRLFQQAFYSNKHTLSATCGAKSFKRFTKQYASFWGSLAACCTYPRFGAGQVMSCPRGRRLGHDSARRVAGRAVPGSVLPHIRRVRARASGAYHVMRVIPFPIGCTPK